MRIYRPILLLSCLFLLLCQRGSWNPADYEFTCSGPGQGRVAYWISYYNDTDGDCISDAWLTYYRFLNGKYEWVISYNENCKIMPWIDCWTEIDFNDFSCCDFAQNRRRGHNWGPNSWDGGGNGVVGYDGSCIFLPNCAGCESFGHYNGCVNNCQGC